MIEHYSSLSLCRARVGGQLVALINEDQFYIT